MSIKSDNWIIEQSKKHELITPFLEEQVREASGNKIISYGVSSYGYDVRCANENQCKKWDRKLFLKCH